MAACKEPNQWEIGERKIRERQRNAAGDRRERARAQERASERESARETKQPLQTDKPTGRQAEVLPRNNACLPRQ